MTLTPPPTLRSFIFLMSDHTTRELAANVADELAKRDGHNVLIDDFVQPINDALGTLLDLDWKIDFHLNSKRGESATDSETYNDLLVSLESWYTDHFGVHSLGDRALSRAIENRKDFDYTIVFRDANPVHVQPFLTTQSWRNMLFVQLDLVWRPNNFPNASWLASANDVATIVKAIEEFDA